MKRIILVCILGLLGLTVYAQKGVDWSGVSVLQGETRLNVVFDYSEASLAGLSVESIKEMDEDWEEGSEEAQLRFTKEFMLNCQLSPRLIIGKYPEANYTLLLKIIEIDEDGECDANVILQDKDENIILNVPRIHSEGGRFGSFTNLMGDGYERLGKKIGDKIEDTIEQLSKPSKKK